MYVDQLILRGVNPDKPYTELNYCMKQVTNVASIEINAHSDVPFQLMSGIAFYNIHSTDLNMNKDKNTDNDNNDDDDDNEQKQQHQHQHPVWQFLFLNRNILSRDLTLSFEQLENVKNVSVQSKISHMKSIAFIESFIEGCRNKPFWYKCTRTEHEEIGYHVHTITVSFRDLLQHQYGKFVFATLREYLVSIDPSKPRSYILVIPGQSNEYPYDVEVSPLTGITPLICQAVNNVPYVHQQTLSSDHHWTISYCPNVFKKTRWSNPYLFNYYKINSFPGIVVISKTNASNDQIGLSEEEVNAMKQCLSPSFAYTGVTSYLMRHFHDTLQLYAYQQSLPVLQEEVPTITRFYPDPLC